MPRNFSQGYVGFRLTALRSVFLLSGLIALTACGSGLESSRISMNSSSSNGDPLGEPAVSVYYKVTSSGSNVTIAPTEAIQVAGLEKATFSVLPKAGFTLSNAVGGTCPTGSWSGNTYSTDPIAGDCSVIFSAVESIVRYNVTASGSRVTINPASVQSVVSGDKQTFAVTAETGYKLSNTTTGSCPTGAFNGSFNAMGTMTYTTGAITADCSVEFSATPAASMGLTKATNTKRPIGTLYAKNGFWEYLPMGYGDGSLSPLLVFFHGVGENGPGDSAGLDIAARAGPSMLIKAGRWPANRPFVVLSVQHPGSGCPSPTEIHDFIAFAQNRYSVDPKRIYLTGLSCGAMGSSGYLAVYGSQQIAAAVLIAGRASPIWNAWGCNFLKDVALWAFHGSADAAVPISDDNATMPKFLACPQPRKDVKYTVYPGVGHDSWSMTYDLSAGHDIYSWLLGISR